MFDGFSRRERLLIGAGLVIVIGLFGALAYQGWEARNRAQAEEVRGATAVAALAPTWTAIVQPTAASPTSTTRPSAAPSPVPATATSRPASATPAVTSVPATKPAAAATPAEEGRYLGRDPLPSGIDLTNGPYLKEMKARGARGVNVGDGGLGDELKAAYLEALKVEEQALNTGDDSRLRQHFIGETLDRLLRLTAKFRADTGARMSVSKYEPLVMAFMPETAVRGVYEVADARTQTISTVERSPNSKPGKAIKEGQPERICYSVQMAKEGGRWKVQSADAENGGPEGHRCPPYWS